MHGIFLKWYWMQLFLKCCFVKYQETDTLSLIKGAGVKSASLRYKHNIHLAAIYDSECFGYAGPEW
jgi:hypothetical protein